MALIAALSLAACQTAGGGSAAEDGGGGGSGGATGLHILSAVRVGSSISVMLDRDLYGVWASYCNQEYVRLLKASGTDWVGLTNARPPCGVSYTLDGVFYRNECNLGCDGGDPCYSLASPFSLSTLEYVAESNSAGAGGTAGAAGSPGTAGAAGASVRSLVTRDSQGPYALDVRYRTSCDANGTQHSEVLPIDVQ